MISRTLFIVAAIIILLAWMPWITNSYAEERVTTHVTERWYGVADGCSLDDVARSRRVPFGVLVEIKYDCGFLPAPRPPKNATIYVSPITTIHGVPG